MAAISKNVFLAIRIAALILLIIAIVCLCVGQYGCFRVLPNAPPIAGMYTGCLWIYPIKYWSYKDYTAPHLVWQYLIFVLSLIAGIFLVVLIVAGSILNKLTRVLILALCIVGAAFMLISFCIEAWFTSGQGMAKGLQWFYIQSWLASTVFYFFVMVLFVVDGILSYTKVAV